MGERIQYVIERCATCGHRRKIFPSRFTTEMVDVERRCPNNHSQKNFMVIGSGHEDSENVPPYPTFEDPNYKQGA